MANGVFHETQSNIHGARHALGSQRGASCRRRDDGRARRVQQRAAALRAGWPAHHARSMPRRLRQLRAAGASDVWRR
ncbi:hypothetical protein CA601_04845, partial [Paraburkholderia hospita]